MRVPLRLERADAATSSPGEAGFGTYLNYLHFGEATLTFPQTLVLRYSRFEPEHRRQPTVADGFVQQELNAGELIIPFRHRVVSAHSYHVMYPDENGDLHARQNFC